MNAAAGSSRQPLPDKVRWRVLEIAAGCLGSMPAGEIPAPLRRVARFELRRRARLAGAQIAGHLEADEEFRHRVADRVREDEPGLAECLDSGTVPAVADPVEVAAAAYLLRPDDWARRVEDAREVLQRQEAASEEAAAAADVARLEEQLAAERRSGREEARRLRSDLRAVRGQVGELRRELRDARERARQAEEQARQAREEAERERKSARESASSAESELRKLRNRLAGAEADAEAARRSTRESRNADDARLRVLLDALLDAAQGLRRELALPSTISHPADLLGAIESTTAGTTAGANAGMDGVAARGLADEDPALLDHLLALPQLHLLVDGYNVTKTGYPTLTLEDQRARLLSGLAALAAQNRIEVTCVFDGADLPAPAPVAAPRGVRAVFSDPGETADDLICRLVRAEPPGRAVLVVSSDREIERNVRRSGARPVPATALLRRLDRG